MLTKPLIWRVKYEDRSILCLLISLLFPVNSIVGGPFAALGPFPVWKRQIDRSGEGRGIKAEHRNRHLNGYENPWENCRIREGHSLKSWKWGQSSVKEMFEIRQTWRCRHSFRIVVFECSKQKTNSRRTYPHSAGELGSDFKLSVSWLGRWKKRLGIKFKRSHGEKSSANVPAAEEWLIRQHNAIDFCYVQRR